MAAEPLPDLPLQSPRAYPMPARWRLAGWWVRQSIALFPQSVKNTKLKKRQRDVDLLPSSACQHRETPGCPSSEVRPGGGHACKVVLAGVSWERIEAGNSSIHISRRAWPRGTTAFWLSDAETAIPHAQNMAGS